jgi:stage II sporulation protein D
MKSPEITVGIMFQPSIEFVLDGVFTFNGKEYSGSHSASYQNGKISFDEQLYDKLSFEGSNPKSTFLLKDVVIGIGFHWERKEDQRFEGNLDFIVEDEKLTAINRISIERYLVSVISSEMSATSSLELLKAHAVISRSWMLSQIQKRTALESSAKSYISDIRTNEEWTKWWDREDHTNFDVCADDHCQRYQGITRASQSLDMVEEAIAQTFGEMLMNGELICDARFSKCCGGAVEEFQNCWEPEKHPYLVKLYDNAEGQLPDLTIEENADKWIRSEPAAFCNTKDAKVLSQVLNNYDQETTNFYRWKVDFDALEMSTLVNRRIGVDFGTILDLIPVERGTSGRLTRLKVVGTKQTLILGKELLIRKAFSESHLYSSAFVIDKTENGFTFTGAGWGHGVGLCQIGAAVMAHKGYAYKAILNHYFPSASIEKKY